MKAEMQIFGTYGVPKEEMEEVIKWAGEAGYRLIDTAWVYENEKEVGQAVAKYNKTHKEKLRIQTKLWPQFNDDVKATLLKQMETLGVKKIYSYLLHRPAVDFNSSIRAWNQLIELKNEGLIEHIGVSNFDKDMLQIIIGTSGVRPECNQIELSVTNMRADRVAVNRKMGIPIQSWSPMGKDLSILKNKVIAKISEQHGAKPGQVILAYLTTQNLCPVVKSANKGRIEENWRANLIRLTSDEIAELEKLNEYANKFEETFPHEHSQVV